MTTSVIISLSWSRSIVDSWRAMTLRRWVDMVANVDLELIAPQHGPIFEGKVVTTSFELVRRSLSECGVDLMADMYVVPPRPDEVQHKHPVRRRSAGTRVTRVENVEKRVRARARAFT